MIWTNKTATPATHPMLSFLRGLSIKTKTFVALAILLACFAGLGFESVSTLGQIRSQLRAVREDTLPKQAIAMDFASDINATHMKVFRFVTLASNGVSRTLLSTLAGEILPELEGETHRLVSLAVRTDLGDDERRELGLIAEKWQLYLDEVKDLLDVGQTDAPMAAMMLGATDEYFQSIASHLGTMAWHVNSRTASTISAIVSNVDANRITVGIGVVAGMVLSTLVAIGFGRGIVRPVQAVTEAMTKVSSGAVDVKIGYRERDDEIGRMVKAIIAFRNITRSHAILLGERNRLFDVALNNMSHGLCMFDADGTLIVHNNRYLEIFGMSPGLIERGCSLMQILDRLEQAGIVSGDKEAYIRDLRDALAAGRSTQTTRTLNDGRIIHIFNRPMAGGGWVATHEDVTERRQNEERVAFLARHDALTELPNRLLFRERTDECLAPVRRGESIAVFCIDLDHFKEVNDTLGHPAGDALLKLVSRRLSQAVRETDVLARLGGDEFAVVQTGLRKPEDVSHLASRIIEVLSEPYEVDGHEVIVGASIGIAIAPHDGDDPDQLLKSADMALYRAKGDGRGTFRFFEAEMDARLQARRRLEIDLRKAVSQGEFEVHYQPIVSLADNQVTAFEALIRWNHPERGMIMPGDFIPLAEDIGLIGAIGEWVLRQSCAEAGRWPRRIRVAVNLSPSQFRKSLVPTVIQALAASGLEPNRLELEITESVLLQNNETTLSMLRQLHDLGVRISMDDFGTGYSSLSYLHSFPFDKIKIDRSFVTDVEARSNCAAIVRAVAGLGNTLGMKTTAEGVETVDQLDWLRSEGCTEVQGFLFSHARPAHELMGLITEIDQKLAA